MCFNVPFVHNQIPVRTGPTPAPSPLQRMASNNTWNPVCTAAKEKVPRGQSEHPTLAGGPRTTPLAPTRGSRRCTPCPSVVVITAGD